MGGKREAAVEVAWRLTHLSPRNKVTCPECQAELIGSEVLSFNDLPDLWSYQDRMPLRAIYGKNQYVEISDVRTYMTIPPHDGIRPDRLHASKELAKNQPLTDLYNKMVMIHNQKCQGQPSPKTFVWAAGNPISAKVLFIGEAPGAVEDSCGIPFSGPAGELLSGVMNEVGIDRENDVLLINSVLTAPDPCQGMGYGIGKPNTLELLEQRPRVMEIINLLNSRETPLKAIICLGKYAWFQLMEPSRLVDAVKNNTEVNFNSYILSKYMGWHPTSKTGLSVPLLCAYHPSYILRKTVKNAPFNQQHHVVKGYLETFKQIKERINA